MATEEPDPHDDKVRSVPLPTEDGDVVVAQENMNPKVSMGGGEWPDPDSPPTGPAPGVANPEGAENSDVPVHQDDAAEAEGKASL
jgi:hypothetical protein